MINIDRIPSPIRCLHRLIEAYEKECYLYGECLLEHVFGRDYISRYDILASISPKVLSSLLGLSYVPDGNKLLRLYFVIKPQEDSHNTTNEGDAVSKGVIGVDGLAVLVRKSFNLLEEDIIEGREDEQIVYVYILFFEGALKDSLERFPIPIDRFAFDLREHYFARPFIEELLKTRRLLLTDKEKESISSSLLDLFKLLRYIVKFELRYTENIVPRIAEKDYRRRLYPKSLWKTELLKLMELAKPSIAFELMRKWGFLHYFFSELMEGYKVYQNEYHKFDVYYHCLHSCDAASEASPLIRLAALFHDIGKPRAKRKKDDVKDVFYDHENIGSRMTYAILRRFGFSHKFARQVSKLVNLHMFHYTPSWTDTAVRRFLRKSENNLSNLLELRKADRLGSGTKKAESKAIDNLLIRIKKVRDEDMSFKIIDLAIGGHDLIKLFSLKEGPIIGNVLKHLMDLVVRKGVCNEKDILINYAREYLDSLGFVSLEGVLNKDIK